MGTLGHAARTADGHGSRRAIDVAVGILVGLRGCSERDAFEELVGVVNRTGLGIFSVATSLAAVAGGASSPDDSEAFNAWGELIRRARLAPVPTAPDVAVSCPGRRDRRRPGPAPDPYR